MGYIFEFKWDKATINDHIFEWARKTNTDIVDKLQCLYADIYNTGKYYKLNVVPVGNNTFEVYALPISPGAKEIKSVRNVSPRAIKVDMPVRHLVLQLDNGEVINETANMPSADARQWYQDRIYRTKTGDHKVVNVLTKG